MPRGPDGEMRSADLLGAANKVTKIANGALGLGGIPVGVGSLREMSDTANAIHMYLAAKDRNRPWLMERSFATDALLEIHVHTDGISFPGRTEGIEAITDVLVRRFGGDFENVYTICLSAAPDPVVERFSCPWLVGMSRKDDGTVRVGFGQYSWTFRSEEPRLVRHLSIAIEGMEILSEAHTKVIMEWLSGLAWPWCPPQKAASAIPALAQLSVIAAFLNNL